MQKLSKTDTYRSKSKCLFRFELQFNSNRIDWRSFCKLWRQWTSCSMAFLLGTRAGLHVEVLHKANRLVALRLWVPLESSACFVCHAFPCAKMCQMLLSLCILYPQCKPQLHPVRNIHPSSCSPAATASPFPFRHSQTLTNQIFDRPKIFRFKKYIKI